MGALVDDMVVKVDNGEGVVHVYLDTKARV